MGPTPTYKMGTCGVFLDPPYTESAERTEGLYNKDSLTVAKEVEQWCRENEDNPKLRIALCGYAGDYDLPGWDCVQWKANGGYANQGDGKRENATKEVIWFSPHCVKPTATGLFAESG